MGRANDRAGFEYTVAGLHVLSLVAYVVGGLFSSKTNLISAGRFGVFDHDDTVGSFGHNSAGHNFRAFPRFDSFFRYLPGKNGLNNF